MARLDLRHPANAEGDWFVDTRCIDCGTCRDLAPSLFAEARGASVIDRQPTAGEMTDAWLAAQACPTQSIGTRSRQPRPGRLYPREIEDGSGVFDCGYCSEDSFGASAWFVRRGVGNVMVDSPRFTAALADPIEKMGGLAHVLLTHRDDVADAHRWAGRFGARVWIHADDANAARFATDVVSGVEAVDVQPGLAAIPTAGHTKGSMMFLLHRRYLFTGDSLAWDHRRGDLTAFRDACWWSWSEQARSLARLAANHRFEWVLPGHGARAHAGSDAMHDRLAALVARMQPQG